jgi:putative aldouronate transport system permease protein
VKIAYGKEERKMKKTGISDKNFERINRVLVLIITLIIMYPIVFVVAASISDPVAVNSGQVWLWPVDITFEGFRRVFQNDAIWLGYRNTIFYTVTGVILHLIVLIPSAYALSRKEVMGRKYITWFIVFTMLFSGGMIPRYLVVDGLGMVNTIWAILIPNLVGAWSILVARSFFSSNIPDSLIESAQIDGASEFTILLKVVLPLSMPIIAVMALFNGVGTWNRYFDALIYISDENLFPLQLILRQILVLNEVSTDTMQAGAIGTASSFVDQINNASLVKYAVMIVSSLPLLVIYPLMQKYFVTGLMVGSVKE